MSNENNIESGFKIINLILMDSQFKRDVSVTFGEIPGKASKVHVDVNCEVNANQVVVKETLTLQLTNNDKTEVSAIVVMVGVFIKVGEIPMSLEEFGKKNGAAIIFPFIREHISTLCLKAGLGQLLLPLINFQILNQEIKNEPVNN